MIRRSLRLCIRLGLLAGIAMALFKLVQGRRSAAELGRPSDQWATPPPPPSTPRVAPEPELVKPVMLEEVIEKKKAPGDAGPADVAAIPAADGLVEKSVPVKRTAAKAAVRKSPPRKAPVPVEQSPAAKAAAIKKAPTAKAPVAKKPAPVKKAPKKAP